ncbi:NAD(P)/FAD-dependent oxidoreductase [Zwartia vadi]|uniref:NAD(P)/FAD-dependent oxidoreductase n=1 Tax=Zwartia vadi TaxID=3058168 RepID=UPI0025B4C165|nr:FAD-dependent oxidoreductase [Zwartia vadi]MDN3986761.1 FAD-dependent oxidoreductase [Zwartia vadi]
MNRSNFFDVVIVGGGIVGSSAALKLREFGLSVCLLERNVCGSRSSGINYGGVRRQGRSLVQMPLTQRAHGIWGRLKQVIGIDGEYVRSGHLKLARSEADMASLTRYRDNTAEYGLGLELLSGAQLRNLYPWLSERAVGGSLCPEDGHANPRLISPAFARAAVRAGAQIYENSSAVEFNHDGNQFLTKVANQSVPLTSRYLLNCAGAWANTVCEIFGEKVPMTNSHPLMVVTDALPVFMNLSLGVEGGGVYVRQVSRGNCVLGGSQGYALDANRARPGGDGIELVLKGALELLPDLRHAQVVRTWSGVEGRLPDREPVISFSSTTPGLVHGFGFAGAGFQIGPAVGEVLAEMIAQGETSTPIEAFSIKRF